MTADLPHPRQAIEAMARAERFLVALDFDGTLAHLVDNPDDARMTRQARSALEELTAFPSVTIALVSGRGLVNLREVSEADPRWWLIGSHGVELEGPSDGGVVQVPTADEAELRALWEAFAEVAARHPGCWLERKPWGAALHTRSLERNLQERVREEARGVIARFGKTVTTRLGHGIIESSLQSQDKGDAILALREFTTPDCTVFIGDDITDEDGFAVLSSTDIGVKVGGADTRARYRLVGPDEVAQFLHELVAAKAQHAEGGH